MYEREPDRLQPAGRQGLVSLGNRVTIVAATHGTGVNVNRRERSWLAWATLALLLASNVPYLIAWAATPADAHFTGLVFNPLDGHSYLAKMRQGFAGSWRFRLAFTPERSPGAHIFLFHLSLGHLARWTGLPLIAVYHGARILGSVAMLAGIYAMTSCLSEQRRERSTMFLLTSVGSGLGWLLLPFRIQAPDLWVPEAFPAYASMANAHFPLAIGLMVGIAGWGLRLMDLGADTERVTGTGWTDGLALTLGALLLGTIQPFGLVPTFGGLGIALLARALRQRSVPWKAGAWIVGAAALALPYLAYMQTAIRSDPVLASWNAQNVTSSPPLWEWALGYGLVAALAAWGSMAAVRRGSSQDFVVLGWTLVTLVGMYLPLPLQRRLSLGLGVPMGLLAGLGWWRGTRSLIRPRFRGLARGAVVALSALTPILLIAMASSTALGPGASDADSWLYLSDGEWAALEWLKINVKGQGEAEPVVLCAPQTGAFVPAWSGLPVVYGHPFETLNADQRRARVESYWIGTMSDAQETAFLVENRVAYVLVGPRERRLMTAAEDSGNLVGSLTKNSRLVFERDMVEVYELSDGESGP